MPPCPICVRYLIRMQFCLNPTQFHHFLVGSRLFRTNVISEVQLAEFLVSNCGFDKSLILMLLNCVGLGKITGDCPVAGCCWYEFAAGPGQ